jgi:hypothetical protein
VSDSLFFHDLVTLACWLPLAFVACCYSHGRGFRKGKEAGVWEGIGFEQSRQEKEPNPPHFEPGFTHAGEVCPFCKVGLNIDSTSIYMCPKCQKTWWAEWPPSKLKDHGGHIGGVRP